MAKKKVVEEVVVSSEVPQEYTNEFRVYTVNGEFTSFSSMDKALAERKANGGTITVASVK